MDSREDAATVVEVRLTGFTAVHYDELVINWLVKDRAYVEMGDPICDIEASKYTETYDAPEDGIITIREVEDIRLSKNPYSILATIETPKDALVIR